MLSVSVFNSIKSFITKEKMLSLKVDNNLYLMLYFFFFYSSIYSLCRIDKIFRCIFFLLKLLVLNKVIAGGFCFESYFFYRHCQFWAIKQSPVPYNQKDLHIFLSYFHPQKCFVKLLDISKCLCRASVHFEGSFYLLHPPLRNKHYLSSLFNMNFANIQNLSFCPCSPYLQIYVYNKSSYLQRLDAF